METPMTTPEQSPAPAHVASRRAPQQVPVETIVPVHNIVPLVPGQTIPEPYEASKAVEPAGIAAENAPKRTYAEAQAETHALEGEQEPDEIKWEDVENRVHLRKFDSEDIVRLRGATIVTSGEDKQTKVNIETGELQKRAIVMAIRSCPWFEDIVHERIGVNAPMFRKRMSEEFRQIPVDILDKLFRVCMEHNKKHFASAEFEKKS